MQRPDHPGTSSQEPSPQVLPHQTSHEPLPSTSSTSSPYLASASTPKPKRTRRDLPFWCKTYFEKIDQLRLDRQEERERRRRERGLAEQERQRRHEERERRHIEKRDIQLQILNVLKDIQNKKS